MTDATVLQCFALQHRGRFNGKKLQTAFSSYEKPSNATEAIQMRAKAFRVGYALAKLVRLRFIVEHEQLRTHVVANLTFVYRGSLMYQAGKICEVGLPHDEPSFAQCAQGEKSLATIPAPTKTTYL